MVDPRINKLLESPNPETRKSAIKALVRTKNRAVLPILADIYRTDDDPEVRDLARKGGIYINNNVPKAPEPLYDDYDEDSYGGGYYDDDDDGMDRLYEDADEANDADDDPGYEEAEEVVPLASEITVSPANQQRAIGFRDQALDLNVAGNDERAVEMLRRALRTNPKLMYDDYTKSLAATITGLDGNDAIEQLGPTKEELKQLAEGRRGRQTSRGAAISQIERIMSGVLIVGALIGCLGYFLLAWVDLSSAAADPIAPEAGTLAENIQDTDFIAESALLLIAVSGQEPSEEVDQRIRDAANSITLTLTGLDTTLASTGISDVVTITGLLRPFEIAIEELAAAFGEEAGLSRDELMDEFLAGAQAEIPPPGVLDYTLLFLPVVLLLGVVFGGLLLVTGNNRLWLASIIFGIIGLVPMIYFYLSGADTLTEQQSAEPGAVVPSILDLLSTGYWLTLIGVLMIAVVPLIALILAPQAEAQA